MTSVIQKGDRVVQINQSSQGKQESGRALAGTPLIPRIIKQTTPPASLFLRTLYSINLEPAQSSLKVGTRFTLRGHEEILRLRIRTAASNAVIWDYGSTLDVFLFPSMPVSFTEKRNFALIWEYVCCLETIGTEEHNLM